jgi:hypothetical protein
MIPSDQEGVYLDFVNEFEEACDCYLLHVTPKKTIDVLVTELDIEYNLLPSIPEGTQPLEGMFKDDNSNFISFLRRPIWHKDYQDWYQKMENGWRYWRIENVYAPLKILDDTDKWRWTYDNIEHIKHRQSKPSAYDDEPQLWRKRKVINPKEVFSSDKYLMITKINEEVCIDEEMLYWEMPNDNEPLGRFINQVGVQVLKDSPRKLVYQDLGVKNGKVDVVFDKRGDVMKLLDLDSWFRDVLPMMYPKQVEEMKARGVYPWKEPTKSLWAEEEEEAELPYHGWKSSLYDYDNRPRMQVFRRLNEDEEFLMLGFEDKCKRLREETVKMMREWKK